MPASKDMTHRNGAAIWIVYRRGGGRIAAETSRCVRLRCADRQAVHQLAEDAQLVTKAAVAQPGEDGALRVAEAREAGEATDGAAREDDARVV
jgi:hypothetical protein